MFDYDWFHGPAFRQHQDAARHQVAIRKFPSISPEEAPQHKQYNAYLEQLECRTLVILRDGASYELKGLISDVDAKGYLTFECEPVDEHYKVGCFVAAVPFDEIVRVEVFSVHPDHKPENNPMIKGFRSSQDNPEK